MVTVTLDSPKIMLRPDEDFRQAGGRIADRSIRTIGAEVIWLNLALRCYAAKHDSGGR